MKPTKKKITLKDSTIEINYNKKAISQELIKFKPNDKYIEVSVSELLKFIQENFREMNLAAAILDTNTNLIPVVDAMVPINFTLEKDMAKGSVLNGLMPLQLPYFIAVVMEAYKLCKTEGDITEVPLEKYEQAAKDFNEKNKKFVETYFEREIKHTPSEETKEVTKLD